MTISMTIYKVVCGTVHEGYSVVALYYDKDEAVKYMLHHVSENNSLHNDPNYPNFTYYPLPEDPFYYEDGWGNFIYVDSIEVLAKFIPKENL